MKPKTYRPWWLWIAVSMLVVGLVAIVAVMCLVDYEELSWNIELWFGLIGALVWILLCSGILVWSLPHRIRISDNTILLCVWHGYSNSAQFDMRKWNKGIEIHRADFLKIEFHPPLLGAKYGACDVLITKINGESVGFKLNAFPSKKKILQQLSEWSR